MSKLTIHPQEAEDANRNHLVQFQDTHQPTTQAMVDGKQLSQTIILSDEQPIRLEQFEEEKFPQNPMSAIGQYERDFTDDIFQPLPDHQQHAPGFETPSIEENFTPTQVSTTQTPTIDFKVRLTMGTAPELLASETAPGAQISDDSEIGEHLKTIECNALLCDALKKHEEQLQTQNSNTNSIDINDTVKGQFQPKKILEMPLDGSLKFYNLQVSLPWEEKQHEIEESKEEVKSPYEEVKEALPKQKKAEEKKRVKKQIEKKLPVAQQKINKVGVINLKQNKMEELYKMCEEFNYYKDRYTYRAVYRLFQRVQHALVERHEKLIENKKLSEAQKHYYNILHTSFPNLEADILDAALNRPIFIASEYKTSLKEYKSKRKDEQYFKAKAVLDKDLGTTFNSENLSAFLKSQASFDFLLYSDFLIQCRQTPPKTRDRRDPDKADTHRKYKTEAENIIDDITAINGFREMVLKLHQNLDQQ